MINVNKLFRRLSLQTKLIIAFCLFGVVPVAVVGGYGALHSFLLLDNAIQDRLQVGVTLKADEIQRFFQSVERNVIFLSANPTLQNLINLPPGHAEERGRLVDRLNEEFLSFSRSHGVYSQVRYIDERGIELVRADFEEQDYHLVPPSRLQEKRDRYYFTEALATPPGSVYVSPIDLNIEKGLVQFPPKPTVRYAVPVHSRQGQPRGVVIINLDASQILTQILTLGQEMGDVSLVSSEGFYFLHSEDSRTSKGLNGSAAPPFHRLMAYHTERPRVRQDMGGLGLEKLLVRDFHVRPPATVLRERPGIIVGPGLQGRIIAFAPIFPNRNHQGEFWVLLHSYSKVETLSSIQSLQIMVLILGGLVLLIAFGMGVVAARSITRPITELMRSAEAVAQGDFDRPVLVETRDEIEDLSHQFTQMSSHLKERQRQVQEAQQRAERKAQEAQVLQRIGTEILAVLSLRQILQLVADKAREFMKCDRAIVCLKEPELGLRVGATSTNSEAPVLRPGERVGTVRCVKLTQSDALCPVTQEILPTHIAVPLRSGEHEVGNLCVGYQVARFMDKDELEFLGGLANLAAIAIENARLHEKVHHLAALEERERISADLHDGIIQSIYGTGLGLVECVRLADENPEEVKRRVEGTIEDLNTVIRDVRNYIVGLQSEGLQGAGLSRSLADLVGRMACNTSPRAELKVEPGLDAALAQEQTGQLFQICREALANVVKHAGASTVVLTLGTVNDVVRLGVEDDGVGFDPACRAPSGHGLRNLEERARRLGGALRVETAPGRGTRITVEFPLKAAA